MLVYKSKNYTKSLKKILRGGKIHILEIEMVIDLLTEGKTLPIKYQDHYLTGEFTGCRECHIRPDLLLIYKIEKNILILTLIDIGSHSKLFGK